MTKIEVPPKPKLARQLIVVAVVLIIVGIIVLIFVKAIIAFIIFLLGAGAGVGSQFIKDAPIE